MPQVNDYSAQPDHDRPSGQFDPSALADSDNPAITRYLWAVGATAEQLPVGTLVSQRYQVIAPQIWLDTQPDRVPDVPDQLPDRILPYLHNARRRLHLPQAYGFCDLLEVGESVLLLDNVPITPDGNLYPTISTAWQTASSTRQAYWLLQLLTLWQVLEPQRLAGSLLRPDNLHVQGWRVWLRELAPTVGHPNLTDLAYPWSRWLADAASRTPIPITRTKGDPGVDPMPEQLSQLCQAMRKRDVTATQIQEQLEAIVYAAAARSPLYISRIGLSDSGPSRLQNEDACYPNWDELTAGFEMGLGTELGRSRLSGNPSLSPDLGNSLGNSLGHAINLEQELERVQPHAETAPLAGLAILCDGVGGHEGGEVASQLAVKSLKLQIATFSRIVTNASRSALVPPQLISEQLAAILRVTNNLIAQENDEQGRQARQRMGTTAVVAWQVPQAIDADRPNTHELYLVSVGDSRAYWITADYCQQLTVDDDLATQEVAAGRCLYREALQYVEASALTQALGTSEGDRLEPRVQRFIIEEDGVLLLCSDGVSDFDWVERSWLQFVPTLLAGESTLEATARDWLELTHEANGHDNASIVLLECRVSEPEPSPLEMFDPKRQALPLVNPPTDPTELADSSKALLSMQAPTVTASSPPVVARRRRRQSTGLTVIGAILTAIVFGSLGVWAVVRYLGAGNPSNLPSPPNPASQPSQPTN